MIFLAILSPTCCLKSCSRTLARRPTSWKEQLEFPEFPQEIGSERNSIIHSNQPQNSRLPTFFDQDIKNPETQKTSKKIWDTQRPTAKPNVRAPKPSGWIGNFNGPRAVAWNNFSCWI